MTNLSNEILEINILSKKIIYGWNLAIPDLRNNYVVKEATVTDVIAEKYRYDLEGLLLFLNIEKKYIYPHVIINGYHSSREYKGDVVKIKILDSNRLEFYYNKMIR